MDGGWPSWAGIFAAYFLGAVPFGLVLGLVFHKVDIRTRGSGNLGATNALRVLGWPTGIAALLLDALKGLLPVVLAPMLAGESGVLYAVCVGLAAILGHVFPVYLRFKGGKGVATSAGVLAILHPAAFGIALVSFALIVGATRYVSLGSLISVLVLTGASVALDGIDAAFGESRPRMILFLLTSLIVFLRHAGNIKRLVKGTESRIGDRSPPPEEARVIDEVKPEVPDK